MPSAADSMSSLSAGDNPPTDRVGELPTVGDGLVIVDKPGGMTSHDVVARVRRILRTRKVGHAGTLDPMATGVLVVGVNRATRLLHHLVLTDKAYEATIRFGESTITDDAEGEVVMRTSATGLDQASVTAALAMLTGEIAQVPSSVSAIKVDGRRGYERVRAGEVVVLPAREVTVHRFTATALRRPTPDLLDVDVDVDCSSGTYVRALARDAGAALGTGGHLTALRRTRVGPFTLSQAVALDDLGQRPRLSLDLPGAIAAAMPVRALTTGEASELSFGRFIAAIGRAGTYGALDPAGRAVALLHEEDDRARPVLVFRDGGASDSS